MLGAPQVQTVRFPKLDSTHLQARRELDTGVLVGPTLLVAGEQSGGVGRFGRPWSSPLGGLWCTLAWPLAGAVASKAPRLHESLGLRLGLACTEFVRDLVPPGYTVQLKWPNDVLLNHRKVLGLLTTFHPGQNPWLLVGVGLNANVCVAELFEDVQTTATTLLTETGRPIDLPGAARRLVDHLLPVLADPARAISADELARARALLANVDHQVQVSLPDGRKSGAVLKGLNAAGRAVVLREGEEVDVAATIQ